MPTIESSPLGRRTLLGAAWAAPVVALAAAAPAAAASGALPALGARAVGPTEYTAAGATEYRIYVANTGSESIVSGTITVLFADPGDGYSFAGFGGSWNYAAQSPDGEIALRYDAALAAGSESGPLLLFLANDDRSQTPVPVAYLMITAPGFDITVLPLEIPY